MSVTILHGDCRQVLATLEAGSVQCCITSPPYFGLRDYGTAAWSGGDAACDHKPPHREYGEKRSSTLGGGKGIISIQEQGVGSYRSICGKCGAVRQDAQIGLEQTPDCDRRHLMRLRSDLTEAQREFVVRRLLGVERRDDV